MNKNILSDIHIHVDGNEEKRWSLFLSKKRRRDKDMSLSQRNRTKKRSTEPHIIIVKKILLLGLFETHYFILLWLSATTALQIVCICDEH